jgi:hypothetical protein
MSENETCVFYAQDVKEGLPAAGRAVEFDWGVHVPPEMRGANEAPSVKVLD